MLRLAMLPSFIPPDLGRKILLTGKSIVALRTLCKVDLVLNGGEERVVDFMFDAKLRADSSPSSIPTPDLPAKTELKGMVDKVYQVVSTRLLETMYKSFKLLVHFRALRRFMLTGQGDFLNHLLVKTPLRALLHSPLKPSNTLLTAHTTLSKSLLTTFFRFFYKNNFRYRQTKYICITCAPHLKPLFGQPLLNARILRCCVA